MEVFTIDVNVPIRKQMAIALQAFEMFTGFRLGR